MFKKISVSLVLVFLLFACARSKAYVEEVFYNSLINIEENGLPQAHSEDSVFLDPKYPQDQAKEAKFKDQRVWYFDDYPVYNPDISYEINLIRFVDSYTGAAKWIVFPKIRYKEGFENVTKIEWSFYFKTWESPLLNAEESPKWKDIPGLKSHHQVVINFVWQAIQAFHKMEKQSKEI